MLEKRQQTILGLNLTTQFNRKQNLIGFFSVDREFESHIAKICQIVFEQVGEFKRKMKLLSPFKTHK